MEPRFHDFLFCVRPCGMNDGAAIHCSCRSIAISRKPKLFLSFFGFFTFFYFFNFFVTYETGVSDRSSILTLKLNTQPCSQGILGF